MGGCRSVAASRPCCSRSCCWARRPWCSAPSASATAATPRAPRRRPRCRSVRSLVRCATRSRPDSARDGRPDVMATVADDAGVWTLVGRTTRVPWPATSPQGVGTSLDGTRTPVVFFGEGIERGSSPRTGAARCGRAHARGDHRVPSRPPRGAHRDGGRRRRDGPEPSPSRWWSSSPGRGPAPPTSRRRRRAGRSCAAPWPGVQEPWRLGPGPFRSTRPPSSPRSARGDCRRRTGSPAPWCATARARSAGRGRDRTADR